MNNKRRVEWIDVAKGLGMICVILAHVDQVYLKLPLYTFHMPLFFFLSGYVFSMKKSFGEFVRSKCKRMLIPYFSLGAVLIVFDIWWNCRQNSLLSVHGYIQANIVCLLTQKRFHTLWFLACLFLLNFLFYVLVRFIKNEYVRGGVVVLLAVLGILYYELGGSGLYWNADVCFTALPFFYGGYLCRKTDFVEKRILANKYKSALFVGFVLLDVVCAVLNYKMSGEHLEMFFNQYGVALLTYIGAFAGVFAAIILSEKCNLRALKYIGLNSMTYYAWHQAIVMPLVYDFYSKRGVSLNVNGPLWNYFGMTVLTTVIICVALTLINEVICRTKLRFMLGK